MCVQFGSVCVFIFYYRSTECYMYVNECVAVFGRPKNIKIDNEDEHILTPLLTRNNMNIDRHGIVTLYPKILLNESS